uniref:Uncharacterized protein n=1 Tax=Panagrolaimus sp. ES5 TaxID=591445 RepID=A0AC34FIT6_9BILA
MSSTQACGCVNRAIFYNADGGRLGLMAKSGNERGNTLLMLGPEKIKMVIENLEKVVQNLNVAILQIFECEFPDFSSNDEICDAFRTKLTAIKIPYCFITEEQAIVSTMLICAKVDVKIGENIIAMFLHDQKLDIYEYEFTKAGYKKIRFDVKDLDKKEQIHSVRGRVIISNPKYVLLAAENLANLLMTRLTKVLKEPRLYAFQFDITESKDVMMVELSKWVLDKTQTKYYILPTVSQNIRIMNTACEELITVDNCECLPLKKSCIIPKSVDFVLILNQNRYQKMNQNCHRNQITISIDADNFLNSESEPIMLPQIESLSLSLNGILDFKNPVIGFCDNFSVICVKKDEENGYEFVENWNAFPETLSDVIVCMDQKKPIFGRSKQKPYCNPNPYFNDGSQTEPGYVVYDLIKILSMPPDAIEVDDRWDLIKILSMPPDAIEVDDRWGFRITQDEDHPVLLEVRTHNDEMKLATPAFLMAIFLKEQIKVIKNEIGEKPKQLSFCILDENYSNEEKERIKNGLKESCDLLKIGCNFVDV